MTHITYSEDISDINWNELKQRLIEDEFDNGRTPAQYLASAQGSRVNVFAFADGQIIGNLRVLSDGVCNAYMVDVWTYSPFRRQGVAKQMVEIALSRLPGQHVYLFTDTAKGLYEACGFEEQGIGMGRVVGTWLVNDTAPPRPTP